MAKRGNPPSNPELAIHTTEDLLNALMERFDHCVFGGIVERGGSHGLTGIIRRHKGHVYICSGLASELGRLGVDGAQGSDQARAAWEAAGGWVVMAFDEERQRQLDMERVQKHVDELAGQFDSVHIFVTRQDPTAEQTVSVQLGAGNWFSRYGQIREWSLKADEGARLEAKKSFDDE